MKDDQFTKLIAVLEHIKDEIELKEFESDSAKTISLLGDISNKIDSLIEVEQDGPAASAIFSRLDSITEKLTLIESKIESIDNKLDSDNSYD